MIYNIPKEPAGPVWDCDGVQWVNQSLTERGDERTLIEVRAVQVDGETVKENQYYRLSGGNLVEVND